MSFRRRSRAAPTHHELLNIKHELEIANKGEKILERRRDGLVFVLLDLLHRWKLLRKSIADRFQHANSLHVLGMEREGDITLRELSRARSKRPELLVDETKILGLRVPMILSAYVSTSISDRGYGVLGTSALDDEIVTAYEDVLELVVRLAEMRAVLARLLAEIRRLRLRVNYLNHRLIPELKADKRYVELHLAEREQEERFRQFRTQKQRRERRKSHRDS